MYVHTGINGSVSDGGVLKHTEFYKKINIGRTNATTTHFAFYTNISAPYIFLGESAFAINKNILKPLPQKNLTQDKRILTTGYHVLEE